MQRLVWDFLTPAWEGCYYAAEAFSKKRPLNLPLRQHIYKVIFFSYPTPHPLPHGIDCYSGICVKLKKRQKHEHISKCICHFGINKKFIKKSTLLPPSLMMTNKPMSICCFSKKRKWHRLSNMRWLKTCYQKTLTCLKGEQSMEQNGSLCSVIGGNLADVTLATQTCFLTEEKREMVTIRKQPQQYSHPTATA